MCRHVVGIFLVEQQPKTFYQVGKRFDSHRCPARNVLIYVADNLPNRHFPLRSQHRNFGDGRVANTPFGQVYDPFESLLILLIDRKPQIRHQIFDFFALVKRQASNDPVLDVELAEGFLKGPRLGVGSVQNGEIVVFQPFLHLILENGLRYQPALLIVGCRLNHVDQ